MSDIHAGHKLGIWRNTAVPRLTARYFVENRSTMNELPQHNLSNSVCCLIYDQTAYMHFPNFFSLVNMLTF